MIGSGTSNGAGGPMATARDTHKYEARLLKLASEWGIRLCTNCSNSYEGKCGDYELKFAVYDDHDCVEARIYDPDYKRAPIAMVKASTVVEAVEQVIAQAKALGHTL